MQVPNRSAAVPDLQSIAYWARAIAAGHLHDAAHAWLEFSEENGTEAIRLLKLGAAKQDKAGKGGVAIPAREMLADMLLELGQPQQALAQYVLSLKTDPNRFNSLYGAAPCR